MQHASRVKRNVLSGLALTGLLAATASGCHAARTPHLEAHGAAPSTAREASPPLEVLPIAAAAPLALAPAPPDEPIEHGPFTIALPAKLACKLEDAGSPRSVELGLSRDGPGFGAIQARSLVARVGVGEREVVVDADAPGLKLRAIAVEGSLDLYAASPVTFESVVVLQSFAELGVVVGETGGIQASLALPKQIVVPKQKALTASVACASLRLQPAKFDAAASLGKVIDAAYLVPGVTALATTAGGKAVAMLNPRGAVGEVNVLARDGRYTQIAWAVEEVIAVGWVDKSRLRSMSPDEDLGFGSLGLHGIGTSGGRRILSCDAEVPLRAQVGNRTEIVGVIAPQTLIAIEGERPYAYEVDIPSTGLSKNDKAVLLVDKEQVASCRG
jgi:hypothetical protein